MGVPIRVAGVSANLSRTGIPPAGSINSYLNLGGRGDRTAYITQTSTFTGLPTAELADLLDGVESISSSAYAADFTGSEAVAGKEFRFQFPTAKNISEITVKFSAVTTHGIWRFQASNDGTVWVDQGATFTLGGSLEQIIDVSGDPLFYTYFRMLGVSGNAVSAPWVNTINFKIKEATKLTGLPDYANYPGTGDYTGWVTSITTTTTLAGTGNINHLFNYASLNQVWFNSGQTLRQIVVQYPEAFVFSEMTFRQSNASSHGTWLLEGSNDGATWDALSTAFTLGGSSVVVVPMTITPTGHSYVRLRQTTGTTSSSPYILSVEFKMIRTTHYAP